MLTPSLLEWLTAGLIFYLPAMAQNAGVYLLAVLAGKSQIPVDGYRKWGDRRLVGDSRGLIGLPLALVLGALIGGFQGRPLEAIHLTVGVDLGTVLSSFFKRRLGIPPGEQLVPLDQLDYILGASFLYWASYGLSGSILAAGLIVGGLAHLLVNLVVRPLVERRLLPA